MAKAPLGAGRRSRNDDVILLGGTACIQADSWASLKELVSGRRGPEKGVFREKLVPPDGHGAVPAGQLVRAEALVEAVFLRLVHAGRTLAARRVVLAELQLFIAQRSSPARLAVALPGLGAGSVPAARVWTALVALLAHPTHAAPALIGLGAVAVFVVALGGADRWTENKLEFPARATKNTGGASHCYP